MPLDRLTSEGLYAALRSVGAIAQLGERLNGIQEVSGSIPLGSTTDRESPGLAVRLNPLAEHLHGPQLCPCLSMGLPV